MQMRDALTGGSGASLGVGKAGLSESLAPHSIQAQVRESRKHIAKRHSSKVGPAAAPSARRAVRRSAAAGEACGMRLLILLLSGRGLIE